MTMESDVSPGQSGFPLMQSSVRTAPASRRGIAHRPARAIPGRPGRI